MKYILYLSLMVCTLSLHAKKIYPKKSTYTIFASWGYNRAHFTKSSIHFIGADYDFTLKNTKAKDRQSPFSTHAFFDVNKLSIPQYNFCIGLTFPSNISISLGQDHMKYVVQQYTYCTLDGYIHNNTEFAGDYQNELKEITPDFVQFEHTDGLNYVHVKVAKQYGWFANRIKHLAVYTDVGAHGGVLIPRSDVTLMHYNRTDEFHLAGYGMGIHSALKVEFYKYLFLRCEAKAGYINMPNILTRGIAYSDRAKQHFAFVEFFYAAGLQYTF